MCFIGERYVLVGFVSVPRYHLSTIARRYGAFSRCVRVHAERDYKEVLGEDEGVQDTCRSSDGSSGVQEHACAAASTTTPTMPYHSGEYIL